MYDFTEETVMPLLKPVEEFLKEIKELVNGPN
jgi:hypothetical protein